MKIADRALVALLLIGGIGHGIGSYLVYGKAPMSLLWALSASFAMFLLGGLNLLRIGRPADASLAWICLIGCLVQAGFALTFGHLIGNYLDPRPLVNAIVAILLAALSARVLVRREA